MPVGAWAHSFRHVLAARQGVPSRSYLNTPRQRLSVESNRDAMTLQFPFAPTYVTRETLANALDIAPSAQLYNAIREETDAGSRNCESICSRVFYPFSGTRYKDFPGRDSATDKLWLDSDELISLTSMTSGGTAVTVADLFLEPVNVGPPFTHIRVDRSTTSALSSGGTSQNAVAMTGVFGYWDLAASAGTLNGTVNSSVTAVAIESANSGTVGVGDLVKIDDERMVVTDKRWVDSGVTASLAASHSADSFTVADGTLFSSGETLVIGTERMLTLDIYGTTIHVRRATQGSTLAAHTTAAVYWPRSLVVQRAVLGTAAAAHTDGATVTRWIAPSLVSNLALAFAEHGLMQRNSGWARTIGTGESEKLVSGRMIQGLEDDVRSAYGRPMRMRTV